MGEIIHQLFFSVGAIIIIGGAFGYLAVGTIKLLNFLVDKREKKQIKPNRYKEVCYCDMCNWFIDEECVRSHTVSGFRPGPNDYCSRGEKFK